MSSSGSPSSPAAVAAAAAAAPYERFVPQGRASLVEDAPGWGDKPLSNSNSLNGVVSDPLSPTTTTTTATATASDISEESETANDASKGPTCWKCRGSCVRKHSPVPPEETIPCTVCSGRGRLPPKRAEVTGATKPGKITRGRRCPAGWLPAGPIPQGMLVDDGDGDDSTGAQENQNDGASKWANMARKASSLREDVEIMDTESNDNADADDSVALPQPPNWIPKMGEELCNLVGSWRILQRVGSHRWTTDDLVTAYVAAQEMPLLLPGNSHDTKLRYLDLGCGNASVLQMVTWFALANNHSLTATGVEARFEAVQLARRSLSFNLGDKAATTNTFKTNTSTNTDAVARIVHGDFRDVCPKLQKEQQQQEEQPQFHLITGTPPYFRVDFAVQNDQVTSAVINQGGMPTARQSAPARCEFRGGIEAYCEAACTVLKPDTGRFVVCENWLNHDRVMAAANKCHLQILRQVQVQGREGKATLFCVYVMRMMQSSSTKNSSGSDSDDDLPTQRENLAVRGENGDWTEHYRRTVLNAMSIPCLEIKVS
jgi:tRNA1Val (adenine37-N6)-methyltransferase